MDVDYDAMADRCYDRGRNDAIEECANIAENFPDAILQLVERPGGPPGNFRRSINGRDIAAAIRGLLAAGQS